jgi:glycosyltransferase involved in cell wall biosynthesis
MPRFSVIIPTYNRAHFVKEAIESVLAQSFSDYELLVVDDGSTDETLRILEGFAGRLKVLRQPKQGSRVARNAGARAASGRYLVFLDDDDLFFPWALEVYDRIIAQRTAKLVVSRLHHFHDGHRPLGDTSTPPTHIDFVEYQDYLCKDRMIRASMSMIAIDRAAFERIGGVATGWFDDVDLLLRACWAGKAVLVLAPSLVAYRWHATNSVRIVADGVEALIGILRKELSGGYREYCPRTFDRYAFLGGPVQAWTRRAIRAGRLGLALRVGLLGFPMIVAASVRRGVRLFRGPRAVSRLPLR